MIESVQGPPAPLSITPLFGGHSEEDPPVPIPNTEVKLFCADGTAWVTMWESRSPPILYNNNAPLESSQRGVAVCRNNSCHIALPAKILDEKSSPEDY